MTPLREATAHAFHEHKRLGAGAGAGAPYVRVASEGGDTVSAYDAANGALTATIRGGINLS